MTQHDPHTTTSARRSRGRYARMTVAAAATAAAMVAGAPAIAGAEPTDEAALVSAPAAPTLAATVDGHKLQITLTDPNTGPGQASTVCTPALVNIKKAIPLLPAIADGTLPPLSELEDGVLAWGPGKPTSFAQREQTYDVPDMRTDVYIALGSCFNVKGTAAAYTPVYIGPKILIGSAVVSVGSAAIQTPGVVAALLGMLGLDTGSLGSLAAVGSTDANGSLGSSTGSLGSAVGPDDTTGSLGSSTGSLGSSTGSLGSATGSSTGSLGSAGDIFTGSVGSSTGSSTNSLGSTNDGIWMGS